jgi:two-component system, OmpR family, KDP operon response regulator KdpE
MAVERRRILIVDDEPQVRCGLRATLLDEGYDVWGARRGDETLDLIRTTQFDLILLGINLLDMAGTEVCRAIRSGFDVPILVLTVCTDERDKITMLDAGANACVTKPFGTRELLARIRALLRRHRPTAAGIFACDDFVVDLSRRTVTREEAAVRLAPKEYQLLRYLAENRRRSVPHRRLLQAVWGPDYGEERTLLHTVVVQLRKKIEPNPRHPRYIVSVPWVGYRFDI